MGIFEYKFVVYSRGAFGLLSTVYMVLDKNRWEELIQVSNFKRITLVSKFENYIISFMWRETVL